MKRGLLFLFAVFSTLTLSSVSWGQGWYGPGWYGPGWGWGPYYAPSYYSVPITGVVKIDTHTKGGQIFIDGAYAGQTGKMRHIYLEPGAYNIQIRAGNKIVTDKKVYVVAGRTVKIVPGI